MWGYIYHDRGLGHARVRMLVALFGRRYFEVHPKTPGASYRVTVHSGDWTRGT